MKKLKKILSMMACCAMVAVSSFTLTGCSEEEIKKNTETITETTIETSSSIIPVELSKDVAMSMLSTAYRNFYTSKSYKLTSSTYSPEYGTSTHTEIGLLHENSNRFIYTLASESEPGSSPEAYVQGIYQISAGNSKLLELNLQDKTYFELSYGKYAESTLADIFLNVFENVSSARYYQGCYYVTSIISTDHKEPEVEPGGDQQLQPIQSKSLKVYEFIIKDNQLVGGTFTELKEESLSQTHDLTFSGFTEFKIEYTNVDTSMIVTSLDGFTAKS